MEHMIQLHIEKLPEGVFLATSDDIQGLIAQGSLRWANHLTIRLLSGRNGQACWLCLQRTYQTTEIIWF
jgi:hypothetical protein